MRRAWMSLAFLILPVGVALAQSNDGEPSVPPADTAAVPQVMLVEEIGADAEGPLFWVTGEYLMWWIKNGSAPPPLVTSAPANSPALVPGALGNPDTNSVLGGRPIEYLMYSGGRIATGLWITPEETIGVEGSYFFLSNQTVQQSASTNGISSPFLVNPFFDADPTANAETANFLGGGLGLGTAGSALLTSSSRLQGAECNALIGFLRESRFRLDFLTGFRFLKLDEGLALATTQTDPFATIFPGQFVNTIDSFDTRNNFYGGQLGAKLDWTRGRLFVHTAGKVALGSTHEVVRIKGFTTTNSGTPSLTTPIPTTTVLGGIYAEPTNIGENSRDRFAVAPEVTVQFGVELSQRVRVFAGYDFIYLSDVARPGAQIDRTINGTQLTSFTGVPTGPLVGPARPAPLFNDSDFWAQGINFGLALGW